MLMVITIVIVIIVIMALVITVIVATIQRTVFIVQIVRINFCNSDFGRLLLSKSCLVFLACLGG